MAQSPLRNISKTIALRARNITGLLPQPVRVALRQVVFAGSAVRCDLCGKGVRKMLPHGGGPDVLERRMVAGGRRIESDRCPVCHGRDRTRALKARLEELIESRNGPIEVLHVAPEYGLYRWLATQPGVSYTATDLDRRRYKSYPAFVEADLTKLPFSDESFDVVICSHVLEHIPDDRAAISETYRVLRPGGEALIMTPEADDGLATDEDLTITDPSVRTVRYGQWDHVRLYAVGEMALRMEHAGFSVTTFLPPPWARSAESLYLGLKR